MRRTRSQGRHRGARRKAPPRSALRASLGRPLRSSPRSALRASLGTHGPTSAPLARRAGALRPRGRGLEGQLDGARAIASRRSRAKPPASLHLVQLFHARTAAMVSPCLAGTKFAKVPRRRVEHPRDNPPNPPTTMLSLPPVGKAGFEVWVLTKGGGSQRQHAVRSILYGLTNLKVCTLTP